MSPQAGGIDVTCTCTSVVGFLTFLTRGHTGGITMTVAASFLSMGAVLYTFFFIAKANALNPRRIFRHPMDVLIFALLFAHLVQALGGLLSLKWILDGTVEVGPFCNAQGIIKIFGATDVAFFTLLVAIFTFHTIATGGEQSMTMTVALVVFVWVFVAILIGAGHGANKDPLKSRYISPTPYWCWVGNDYLLWRLASEYLWLWITLFASILLYIPLYLWMRGNLDNPWSFRFHRTLLDPQHSATRRTALVMLLYPIVNCVCIIPLSVVRMITFVEHAKYGDSTMPSVYTFIVGTIFLLSGFFDVILIFTTRPNLGLFGQQGAMPAVPAMPAMPPTPEIEPLEVMVRFPSEAGPSNTSRQV